ncbi:MULTISPECIES: TetR/AcrR family transcriptional regulator [unclassified Roseivivax]|uniref:TetR/AcrR family transcriptional regulator n=1 Tax=Roseivivax sp. GX 12232 TaxID=2900547 RepID=UPI001E61EEFA|nr:TetR/AcrR family transcriptional regulator [Roseivivax sp. GX 12232]MCE0507228.1 TetR/AcrR family transcriptional regulator [Roseivivax sp. GX 12232]
MARTRGSHSDITGPRVERAALDLFAKEGFAAVSMRRIASRVGVQAGALYNYTPDKQTLLYSLLKTHMEDLLAAYHDWPKPADPLGRLEAFTRFHIRYNSERPQAVFISYMELRNLTPAHFAEIEELRRSYEGALVEILREGREAGVFGIEDARIAAFAVIGMLTQVNTWYRDGGRLSLAEVEELYWAMVRRLAAA